MRTLKMISLILAVVFLSAVFYGCSPAETAVETADPVPQNSSPTPEPIVIKDALGREVILEGTPKRIILAGRALFMVADALYTFPEALDSIVATGDTGQSGNSNFILSIDPAYPQKKLLSSESGAEEIAALNPDVVILKSYLAKSMGAPIETLGIPVVYVAFETPEQYEADFTQLGVMFGNPERAEQVLDYYRSRLARVKDTVPEGEDKPRVLLLYYSDKDGEIAFNVPPLSWIQTTMVTNAGGEAVWADANPIDGWTKVNLEQVAAWDADKIFVISYIRPVDDVTAELKADPQWQSLRAVKDGQLYGFARDFYSWDQPDTRWILGQMWLAKKLYPAQFADLDLDAEIKAFYSTLYNLDEVQVEQLVFPQLKGDLP